MFRLLKRQILQRQGYSCGRKRRENGGNEWTEVLRTSPFVRYLILAAFVCALGVLVKYLPPGSAVQALPQGMGIGLLLVLLPVSLAHVKLNTPETWSRSGRFLMTYGILLIHMALLLAVWTVAHINKLQPNLGLLLAPCALAPMTLTLLLGERQGSFAAVYTSLWGGLLCHADIAPHFTALSLMTGLISVWMVRRLRKRSELMRAGFLAGITAFAAAAVLGRVEQAWLPVAGENAWQLLGMEFLAAMLTGLFTAMLVGGVLPLLEAIFGITTTISWIELADLNHPLLRRLTLEAPGTYHHSLMVANLAETAAETVGADATMCRVCSYFHDIGKLVKPDYYIENMPGDENPHDSLSPSMSTLILAAHVKDGIDLACRHKLNREIMDVIQQHHGTSLIYYFYRRALDQQEEAKKSVAEGRIPETDVPEVNPATFRYPGPKCSFRESAIISLADAVESASRALSKPTPQKIETMVEEIIRSRIKDGQMDECDLTLRELSLIRESFTKTLRTSLHRRVPYPEEKEKTRSDNAPSDRMEERDRSTTYYDRPRPAKTPPPAAAKQGDATVTNIIPMPATAPVAEPDRKVQ